MKQHGGSVFDISLPAIMLQQESHLRVLRILETNPQISQRELSEALGVSLGKTNYCLKALLDKGLIKIQNFRNSTNKLTYSYLLTPHGIEQKAHMTIRYLQKKTQEYDLLRLEIAELKREIEK